MSFGKQSKSLSSTYTRCVFLPTTANLKPSTQIIVFLFTLLSAFTMTSIFQRLTRPFTSSTMRFTPDSAAQTMNVPEGAQKATLAAGCFWGIEHMYRKDFGKKGLLDARVGYIGGDTENPTYRAVCSGRTGREYTPLYLRAKQKMLTMSQTQKPAN